MTKRPARRRTATLAAVAAIAVTVPMLSGALGIGAASTASATVVTDTAAPAGTDTGAAFAVPTSVGSTRATAALPSPPLARETVLLHDGTATQVLAGGGSVTLYTRGVACKGAPAMTVAVDGRTVSKAPAKGSTYFWSATYPTALAAGSHTVSVTYTNSYSSSSCTRSLILGWATLSMPAAGSTPAPTPTPDSPSGQSMPTGSLGGAKQVFAEDFSGSAINSSKWSVYNGVPTAYPRTTWRPQNAIVSGGTLDLAAYYDSAAHKWTSAGVNGGKGLRQLYGTWEVRMRADRAAGVGIAAMLYPKTGWPPEIDFAEEDGGLRTRVTGTLHYGSKNTQIHSAATLDMTKWHTYGVVWTPGLLQYTVDGKVWATVRSAGVPRVPMNFDVQSQTDGCTKAGSCTVPGQSRVNTEIDWVVAYAYQG